MLEFLVLGVIPGTTIQITFGWFVVVVGTVCLYVLLRVAYQGRRHIYRLIRRAYTQYAMPVVKQLLLYIHRQYTLTK